MDYVPLSLRVGQVGAARELFFDASRQPLNQGASVRPPIPQSVGPPIIQKEGYYDSPGEPEEEAPRRGSSSEWIREKLFRDNLVVDSPVPEDFLQQVPHAAPQERDEFTHVRYSAVTCSPAEFSDKNFILRQELFQKPRHTEILINLSLKDEGEVPFARTLLGVIQNIEYIDNRAASPWGKDGWKKIVVCVQSDGHPDKKVLGLLRAMGIFFTFDYTLSIPEIETVIDTNPRVVNGYKLEAHLYEYCTQFKPVLDKNSVIAVRGKTPVQVLFCLTERDAFRPEDSHGCTWLEAFAKRLEPSLCINIGVDTNVGKDAFYPIWKSYESRDDKIKPDRNIGDMPVYNFKGNILNRWGAAISGRFR